MKGNVKKIFAAVLALAIVISVAGCGSKKAGYSEDGTYEVTWYSAETPQPDHNLVYEELSKYTKDKIGVTVKFTPFMWAEYAEKMQLLFASGEKVDMCFASGGLSFNSNARQSAYMDMGDVLESVGAPTKALLPDYALDAFKVGGVQYAIPVLKDWASQPVIQAKYGLLEEVGMLEEAENADSLADFTPIIDAVVEKHPDYYGILMRGNHNLLKFLPLEQIGGTVIAGFSFDNFDTVINIFETKEFADLLDLVRTWYQSGYIKNDAATSTDDSAIAKVNNFFASHGEWLPYYGVNDDPNDPNRSVFCRNICNPRLMTGGLNAGGIAMGATCVDPEKTMEFINMLYTDEYVRNTVAYGIENKHWVADGESHYKLPDGVEKATDTGYASGVWTSGNRFILKVAPNTPADIWEKYQEFNENADVSPAIGFTFDPQPVSGQIAAVSNAYAEYFNALIVGAVDPAVKLPEFLNKIKAVGADEIVAEAQRQYDEWKKTK